MLAALGEAAEGALDDRGEIRIVLAVHQPVRVVGQILADDMVVGRRLGRVATRP